MRLPTPEPGLVIGYSYLWAREHGAGREEGVKDFACLRRGITPPDNQAPDYPIASEDSAYVVGRS
jgi:hypothetical protein